MGLYSRIDRGSLPEEIVVPLALSGGFATEVVTYIDYTPAFEAACEAFDEVANDLVPVDTGYLQSTIYSMCDSQSASFYADAEYAQYVEYGTYKMDAQPYFRPAIEAAKGAFMEVAQELVEYAQQDVMFEVGSFNMESGSIDALLGLVELVFSIIIMVLIQEFINTITGGDGSVGGGDIIIT